MENGKYIRLTQFKVLRMKTTKIVLILLLTMTLSNCNSKKTESTSKVLDEVSVQFLKSQFDNNKAFYLLDVRTIPEFEQGRLSFANDLIPYDSIQLYIDKLPQNKDTTIYVICRSGRRSGIATAYLRSLGYTNAHNVTGGVLAWQKAGYEIVSGKP